MDWNEKGMEIFVNFSNPSLLSSGSNFDIINIKVVNGSNFTSLNREIHLIE